MVGDAPLPGGAVHFAGVGQAGGQRLFAEHGQPWAIAASEIFAWKGSGVTLVTLVKLLRAQHLAIVR